MILREVWRASGRKTPWRVRAESENLEVRVPSDTVREEVVRGLDHRSAARDLSW